MVPGLNQETEVEVLRDVRQPVETELVRRVDNLCQDGGDPWAPARLYFPQPFHGTRDAPRVNFNNFTIKFTDFGGCECAIVCVTPCSPG